MKTGRTRRQDQWGEEAGKRHKKCHWQKRRRLKRLHLESWKRGQKWPEQTSHWRLRRTGRVCFFCVCITRLSAHYHFSDTRFEILNDTQIFRSLIIFLSVYISKPNCSKKQLFIPMFRHLQWQFIPEQKRADCAPMSLVGATCRRWHDCKTPIDLLHELLCLVALKA